MSDTSRKTRLAATVTESGPKGTTTTTTTITITAKPKRAPHPPLPLWTTPLP